MSNRLFNPCVVAVMLISGSAYGQNQQFRHLQGGRVGGVFFFDSDHGWTAEDGARVRFTQDAGQSWEYGFTPVDFREELTDIYFIGVQDGWAVSAEGSVLRSFDGGETWEKINTDPAFMTDFNDNPAKLNTIFMHNSADGWVGGDAGALWYTEDGGESWTEAPVSRPRAHRVRRGPRAGGTAPGRRFPGSCSR